MEQEINYQAAIEDINRMAKIDQDMRKNSEGGKNRDPNVDLENTKRLKEIVGKIGWPSISRVGEEASRNAWLLVQHADRDKDFQEYCLNLMEALPEEEVSRHDIAYLRDRIRRNQNLPQIYGTQFIPDTITGKYKPAPIENPESVEERRKEMGLDTLEENTKRINDR